MKVLVLSSLFGMALCQQSSEGQCPDWANETEFGVYQKANKSFKASKTKRFHLVKLSTNGSLWSKETTCVKVTAVETSVDVFNITVSYKNSSVVQTAFSTATLLNVYNYTGKKNGFRNEPHGYELWVVEGKQGHVPACCDFLYKYLTLGMKTRALYSKDCEIQVSNGTGAIETKC
ncbi:male-specific histamine-binding salivary protein-like [Rhipicephalus sanguineus]|uniref:male-specific histamine-binding salivary protein-like n=1 Tax=Rhipicephalus sanguineus TaxID=34632 RepID=UPI00189609E8|nr:male-specific histamine-binding salivary protein-like [Rhipicephalus sanguineus]